MKLKKLKRQLESKPITLTHKEIEKLKEQATDNAAAIINLMPLLILRDKFGFGRVRLERYLDHYSEMMEAHSEGYISLKDIEKVLEAEVGLKFKWGHERYEVAE